MKTYVYPAVLYSGDDGFEYLSLPDLNLLTVGDTTEETFVKGRQSLISYFELATRFDTEIPEPSTFEDIKKRYPDKNVMMLDVSVEETNPEPQEDDIKFKNFMKLFFDEGE